MAKQTAKTATAMKKGPLPLWATFASEELCIPVVSMGIGCKNNSPKTHSAIIASETKTPTRKAPTELYIYEMEDSGLNHLYSMWIVCTFGIIYDAWIWRA